ncbi:DUF4382 domain-containing protein [Ekhidna sp.]|uniref:DUF4382 domain-containing protein n=1 Tax=Ekhidna sp. TaxID=2608089 RepID=UPI003B59CA49
MNRTSKLFHFSFTIGVFFILCACSTESDEEAIDKFPRLKFSLIDAPAVFDEVNIDIRQLQVNFVETDDEKAKEWLDISDFNPVIVDILSLTNGKELTLVDRPMAFDYVDEIRLILGNMNYLLVNGDSSELKIPSGEQTGIKIKLSQPIEADNDYDFLLDFDASQSIKAAGNSGKYILKPVIRAKLKSKTGSISGKVLPAIRGVTAYAITGSDSVSTVTGDDGFFLIRGLDEGVYRVSVAYKERTLQKPSIQLYPGMIFNSGTFDFQ